MFNVVITNVENGYNPSTGVLTSPLCETYVFHVSAVECSELCLYLDILLNNVSKVRLTGICDSGYRTGNNMVLLDLQKGDRVWVRHADGKSYFCQFVPITTF